MPKEQFPNNIQFERKLTHQGMHSKTTCKKNSICLKLGVHFEFYTVIKETISSVILMVKCVSFTKTLLLIIVSGIT